MSNARILLLSAVVASSALAAPAFAGNPNDGNTTKSSDGSQSRICKDMTGAPSGTIALNGPTTLFPPNHKMVTETGVAQGKPGTMMTSLTLKAATVDDVLGGDGSPSEGPDSTAGAGSGTDSATASYAVRAERSGKGDGRTYTIDWTVTFDSTTCSSDASSSDPDLQPFHVYVPHDMGKGND